MASKERKGFFHWAKTKWHYLGAKLNMKHEANADTRVQLEQTIQKIKSKFDAQHQQTIQMVAIRKKYELDLAKEHEKAELLQAEVDSSLLMIEEAKTAGDEAQAEQLTLAAQSTAQELSIASDRVEELKESVMRAAESAEDAKQARDEAEVELKAIFARRSTIINKIEEAKMAQLQADTMRAINGINTDDDIMTLEEIEEKVTNQFALGSGALEIESGGVEMQRRQIRRRSRLKVADNLLEARRKELGMKTNEAPLLEAAAEAETAES